jgi:hypothetical protein
MTCSASALLKPPMPKNGSRATPIVPVLHTPICFVVLSCRFGVFVLQSMIAA